MGSEYDYNELNLNEIQHVSGGDAYFCECTHGNSVILKDCSWCDRWCYDHKLGHMYSCVLAESGHRRSI